MLPYPNRALRAKAVRDYLASNPGSTHAEIKDATGYSVTELQSLGLAYWKRIDGVTRWFTKDGIARPPKKDEEWRWDPDTLHWESAEEVNETRWEAYRP